MASLAKDRRLQFPAPDGKRKTIRLGSKMPMKQARGIQRHVERLNACQLDGSAPPEETSRWVAGISTTPRDKLVRVGLLQQEEAAIGYTLGELLDDYKGRPKWGGFKPKTRQNKQRCLGYAIDYFDQNSQFVVSPPQTPKTSMTTCCWRRAKVARDTPWQRAT